jgi:hypothetical protein
MTNWQSAVQAWHLLLDRVSQARQDVDGQVRGVWFRGLEDEAFPLRPSIYRTNVTVLETLSVESGLKQQVLQQTEPQRLEALVRGLTEAKKISMQFRKATSGAIERIVALQQHKQAAGANQGELDRRISLLRANLLGSIPAELDAFHEFKNRGRLDQSDSWSVLTIMRHRGVPTRLMDWSESFVVALYFALSAYLRNLSEHWRDPTDWKDNRPPFFAPNLPRPAVWVMNPFLLAGQSSLYGAIPYPNHPPLPDYYSALLVDQSWPFARAIPIHAPKLDSRIESQRGAFTFHGSDSLPVDEQIKKGERDGTLVKVPIEIEAAVYGAYFLWQFVNLDDYELMRDLDTLGKVVGNRHLQSETPTKCPSCEAIGRAARTKKQPDLMTCRACRHQWRPPTNGRQARKVHQETSQRS